MLKESDRLLLTRYAPACVLVDEDLNILQFRGETSLYLEHRPGPARRTTMLSERDRNFQYLRRELEAARELLQTTIGTQEAAKEELKSAQEELLSANEEFQTTNEELETAKEELQATNEELITTNDELRRRNWELSQSNDALRASRDYAEAIIATVQEPLLILNKELRVIRANHAFYEFFKTSPEEIENRRLYEIGENQWDDPSLRAQLEEIVSRNASLREFEMVKAFPQIGEKVLVLQAHRLPPDEQRGDLILLAIDDITDRKALEESRRAEREQIIEEQASDIRGLARPRLKPVRCRGNIVG